MSATRRSSLAAGASRRDRYGPLAPRHGHTSKRYPIRQSIDQLPPNDTHTTHQEEHDFIDAPQQDDDIDDTGSDPEPLEQPNEPESEPDDERKESEEEPDEPMDQSLVEDESPASPAAAASFVTPDPSEKKKKKVAPKKKRHSVIPFQQERPSRKRLEPIEWWKTQDLNYHRTADGIGKHMPVIDEEEPVVQYAKSPAVKPKPPRKRPATKALKHPIKLLKGNGGKRAQQDEDEDEDDLGVPREPLPPLMKIVDPTGVEIEVLPLVKYPGNVPFESLAKAAGSNSLDEDDDEEEGARPRISPPFAGKAFEQPEFSTGLLTLPPNSKKQREVASSHEVFFVTSCPPNGLTLSLHSQTMKVSSGAQFMVPAGNTYELVNNSPTAKIQLMFVLVRPMGS